MSSSLTSLRFNTQAQQDIQRMSRDLTDLQRQIASSVKSNDLGGYGVAAARLLNTTGLASLATARASAAQQLEARFGVQASAINQAATAAGNLSQALKDAITNDNVDALSTELRANFALGVSALNESWNGQPLFAGERLDGPPITIGSVDDLVTAGAISNIFHEADRPQVVDFGPGARLALADRASELGTKMFTAMRDLTLITQQWGANPPDTLTQGQRDQLRAIADMLDSSREDLNGAEGHAGQLQERIVAERIRQTNRSTLLQKEAGEISDADIAEVSIQVNTLLAQYQATAKTFADISQLSLLPFLD